MIRFRTMSLFVLSLPTLFNTDVGGVAEVSSPGLHKEVAVFQTWDRKNSVPEDAVLFTGSSSIRMWTTRESFPDLPVINRGFGGSHISDVVYFSDRIVLPYEPKVIVLYAGDNDIAAGKTPKRVFDDFQELAGLVGRNLPETRIVFISIRCSPSRFTLWPMMDEANSMIKRFCEGNDRLFYADCATPLLRPDKKPDPEFFAEDRLHLSKKGYQAWTKVLTPIIRDALKTDKKK